LRGEFPFASEFHTCFLSCAEDVAKVVKHNVHKVTGELWETKLDQTCFMIGSKSTLESVLRDI